MNKIRFNKPFLAGKESQFINEVLNSDKISGNGKYTHLCQAFLEKYLRANKALLTNSCTDALEMTAILSNIKPGDEVIMPTYTFVSTANAFILRGAIIRFVDSRPDYPGIDESKIEEVINKKTKAIVVVHYAGIACDMDFVIALARKYNIIVIEDAAQAIDSYYNDKLLGSIGDFGCFSFHDTKNIHCGEGGLLSINNPKFKERAEIVWEKGTNRSAFWRGEVDKYNWMDIGSSYLPSEVSAAFLLAQLEELENIQNLRKAIWEKYYNGLKMLENLEVKLPDIPDYATNNAHMFYLVCKSLDERSLLINYLKKKGISAVFHYICLHDSPYYKNKHDGRRMSNAKKYELRLVRLPLFCELKDNDQFKIIESINKFYDK